MKYRELVRFDPIQEVKVLTEADDLDHARRDVRTFVFSDRLLAVLRDVIVPQLRFDQPGDQKGLLIVANYGTGKTHLMSVLSSVAEHAELADELRRREARDELEPVAGRFHVIRAEIGATQMSLRDIVCRELEEGLKHLGVSYSFPPVTEVVTNKDHLEQMMAVFGDAYPDRGLLFVLDELLSTSGGARTPNSTSTFGSSARWGRSAGAHASGSWPGSRRPSSTTRASPTSPPTSVG